MCDVKAFQHEVQLRTAGGLTVTDITNEVREAVVASGVMVALVLLGVGTIGRSLTTSDASSSQEQAVATPSTQESSGPGAAGVEEDTSFDDSTIPDDGAIADDGETYDFDDDRVIRRLDEPPMPMRYRLRPGPRAPGPLPRVHVEIRSLGEPDGLNDSDEDDDEDEDDADD